jgi:hypothetical protein
MLFNDATAQTARAGGQRGVVDYSREVIQFPSIRPIYLEHFPAKWEPGSPQKMRPLKKITRANSESIGTEFALVQPSKLFVRKMEGS